MPIITDYITSYVGMLAVTASLINPQRA